MDKRDMFRGFQAEAAFSQLLDGLEPTDRLTDIRTHTDFVLRVKFDVKALKSATKGQGTDENIHWVEVANVQGRKGWLYGDADYFAFETEKYYILVQRNKLTEFIEPFITEPQIKTKDVELYTSYQRKGRKDHIILVSTLDLAYLADGILKK